MTLYSAYDRCGKTNSSGPRRQPSILHSQTFPVPAGNPAGIMVRYRVMMKTTALCTFGTIKTRLFIALMLAVP